MHKLSDVSTARLKELERIRDRHLALADELDGDGRTAAAWVERQAGLRVSYNLATIRRKLTELQYVRSRTIPSVRD